MTKAQEINKKLRGLKKGRYIQEFDPEQIELLVELALSGEYPDGNYGDDEVAAWELIRRALRKGGVII